MRIFTGKPRNRFGYAIEDWAEVRRDEHGRHHEKQLPDCVHQEITRIWGIAAFGLFIGVQKVRFV